MSPGLRLKLNFAWIVLIKVENSGKEKLLDQEIYQSREWNFPAFGRRAILSCKRNSETKEAGCDSAFRDV